MDQARIAVCALLLLSLGTLSPASPKAVELGTPVGIESKVLGRTMTLVVHLPEGYDSGPGRYPVLYMLGSDWRAHFALAASTLDMMAAMGQIPATILVGIDLPEGNFVLVPRGTPPDTSGLDAHLAFLADEVAPRIEKEYRTAPFRILYGASNSGLFAVYALVTRPVLFNAYLASSPMLGWCGELIAERARKALTAGDLPRRALAVIYSDDDYDRVVQAVPPFLAVLAEVKPDWFSWSSEVRRNEGHVPTVDLALTLKAVFPDYNPPATLASVDEMAAHFRGLSKRYGFDIPVPTEMVFDLGMEHFVANRLDEAQEVFEWATATYPRSSRGYVGLGLVHERRGNKDEALEWMRRALAENPGDALAERVLVRLQTSE